MRSKVEWDCKEIHDRQSESLLSIGHYDTSWKVGTVVGCRPRPESRHALLTLATVEEALQIHEHRSRIGTITIYILDQEIRFASAHTKLLNFGF